MDIGNLRVLMTADTLGGVWTYSMELAEKLGAQGIEVVLATMGRKLTTEQWSQVDALETVTVFESEFKLEWMDNAWADVDASGTWLLDIARRVKADIVHLNGYAHASLPWNIPVLICAHSCVLSWWQSVKSEKLPPHYLEYQARVEEGLQRADLVVSPSFAMQHALEHHYRFDSECRVIPNGRDPRHFQPQQKNAVILSAGRLWDEGKNIAVLEQIAANSKWPIRIAGEQRQTRSIEVMLESKCEGNISNLSWLGFLTAREFSAELSDAAIYAAPAFYEPFGLGVLEAAMSGCALVLSDIPSFRENWADAAVFVAPRDTNGWRESLNQVASDEQFRLKLAAQSRERSEQFHSDRCADAYLAAYTELLTKPTLSSEACLAR